MLTEENKHNLEDTPINQDSNITIDAYEEGNDEKNVKTNSTDELNNLKNQLAEQKDKFLRLYAEFENYKRRTAKEKVDMIKTAGLDIISDLISILDDFDRAQKIALENENSNAYPEGFGLVHHKLLTMLHQRGLSSMSSTGVVFDPEFHEAIAEVPAPSEELKGKIVDTVEKGYLLSDKIIRFAKVVVGN